MIMPFKLLKPVVEMPNSFAYRNNSAFYTCCGRDTQKKIDFTRGLQRFKNEFE
jgi:hypothetical protein